MEQVAPNTAHFSLVNLETAGHISLLVTQNVDRLHQRAGHRRVVDLHGRIDQVICLNCESRLPRSRMQEMLIELNPDLSHLAVSALPDGDAELADDLIGDFRVPECGLCGGNLMPNVVFYGGSVPRQRVELINQAVAEADALLTVGSSLMVFSAFRFCRLAQQLNKPLAILNRGKTRADDLASLRITADCDEILFDLSRQLESRPH